MEASRDLEECWMYMTAGERNAWGRAARELEEVLGADHVLVKRFTMRATGELVRGVGGGPIDPRDPNRLERLMAEAAAVQVLTNCRADHRVKVIDRFCRECGRKLGVEEQPDEGCYWCGT